MKRNFAAQVLLTIGICLFLHCNNTPPPPLANLGNTCYSNAVTQNLHNLTDFRSDLIAAKNIATPHLSGLKTVLSTMQSYQEGSTDEVTLETTLKDLAANICKHPQFEEQRQEDAHELLQFTLTAIEESQKELLRNSYELFKITTARELVCPTKQNGYKTFEKYDSAERRAFFEITPENNQIFSENEVSIVTRTERYTELTNLTPEEQRTFQRDAGGRTTCYIHEHVETIPLENQYAIFGIHRFTQEEIEEGRFIPKKITDPYTFPEHIYLKPRVGPTQKYTLVGTVNHHGESLGGGHYTAYINSGGQWYICDDTRIERTTWETISNEAQRTCYMLFYKKVDPLEELAKALNSL